ncbi:hypothetical protein V6N11_072786 [Hibiscus sabdariffa]|uniref:Uncharacterized protein n=1 Tax=Hibiscus sabdariffa TaxID=183260 RepID=A0ABR2NE43_9ROSI
MISISEIGFSDDSDRPWDRKWKSAKEESDDLKDVESFSDVNSPKRGMVGEDGCSSGTEVDAIKAMCAEREYDDYCHREKNGLGSRSIGEEGLGGSSKEETADYGNRNEEGNKENGAKNVLGAEIEEEGCNCWARDLLGSWVNPSAGSGSVRASVSFKKEDEKMMMKARE